MKSKILIMCVALCGLVGLSFANYDNYNEGWKTKSYGTLKASYSDGIVKLSWSKFAGWEGDEFQYYKVIRSQTNASPVYPEDGYIRYDSNRGFTSYTDTEAPSGKNYYRVCAILGNKKRYCTNTVTVTVKETQKEEYHEDEEDDSSTEEVKAPVKKEENKNALSAKVDVIAKAFIDKINAKFGSDTAKKNQIIDNVVSQLDNLARKQPKLKSFIKLLNDKLLAERNDLQEIEDILKLE